MFCRMFYDSYGQLYRIGIKTKESEKAFLFDLFQVFIHIYGLNKAISNGAVVHDVIDSYKSLLDMVTK